MKETAIYINETVKEVLSFLRDQILKGEIKTKPGVTVEEAVKDLDKKIKSIEEHIKKMEEENDN